jgi:DNA mismatch repair protein MutS2
VSAQATPVFSVGDEVYLPDMRLQGSVIALNPRKGTLEVQVGVFRYTRKYTEVQPAESGAKSPAPSSSSVQRLLISARQRTQAQEIDLHGLTVLEALHALEKQLHAAVLAGVREVKVIHGHGSGALKRAVHEFCTSYPLVDQVSPDQWNPAVTRLLLTQL